MQKIILFIEPCEEASDTPHKIGNLFMNRFAVDEHLKVEILRIYELECAQYDYFQKDVDLDLGIDRTSMY